MIVILIAIVFASSSLCSMSPKVNSVVNKEIVSLKKLCLIKCAQLIENGHVNEKDISNKQAFSDVCEMANFAIEERPELEKLRFISSDHVLVFRTRKENESEIINRKDDNRIILPMEAGFGKGLFLGNKCCFLSYSVDYYKTDIRIYDFTKQENKIRATANVKVSDVVLCTLNNNTIGFNDNYKKFATLDMQNFSKKVSNKDTSIGIRSMAKLKNNLIVIGDHLAEDDIHVWDYAREELFKKLILPAKFRHYNNLASNNDNYVASYGYNGINIYDIDKPTSKELIATFDFKGQFFSACFDKTSTYILGGGDKDHSNIYIWDILGQQLVYVISWFREFPVCFISISDNNQEIIIKDGDSCVGEIRNFDVDLLPAAAAIEQLKKKLAIKQPQIN